MPREHLLIIEDDPTLRRGLSDNFEQRGFRVHTAADGEAGLGAALNDPPDLVLLDIMLPKVNGFEVCRAIRQRKLDMPIVILTAKGQEQDIVRGLDLGADDYVTKPFNIRELVARVSALLRRRQADQTDVYRFGDCELDMVSHRFAKGGVETALTPKEFRMLAYFAKRPGRALTRNDIMDEVWGGNVIVTARSVDRCITTLRTKIEPNPHQPTYIQTIRDIGYRFEPPSAVSDDAAPPAGHPDPTERDNAAGVSEPASKTHPVSELELRRAHDLQMSLVPVSPSVQGLDIAIDFKPCRWIGGDYVDVIRAADRRVVLIMADVCGKGLPAAMIAAKLHALTNASLGSGHGLIRMMQQVNEHLCSYLDDQMFVTMVALAIDPIYRTVECINAGHLPPVVIDAEGQTRDLQHSAHLPLGVAREAMSSEQTQIQAGNLLAMITDGLTELRDADGNMLGQDSITTHLRALHMNHPKKSVSQIGEELGMILDQTQADHESLDDRTFLLAKPV